jgi:SAM-dependent methyltransferase
MIINKDEFDRMVEEAWQHEFSGWDFSYVSGRMLESPLAWDYHQIVLEQFRDVNSLLDMDTGGGEFLSSLQPLPPVTIATEGYPPNVPVAKARLGPLGVEVIDTWAPVPLPFDDNSFDLVINRHGGYRAAELYRVLKPGKRFVTQQVGGSNCIHLNEMLQDRVEFQYSYWTLEYAVRELEESGFRIIDQREDYPSLEFVDIGAVVYYLKVISWQVSGFTIEKYYDKLARIHNLIQETGSFVVSEHRFFIEAQKPII